MASLPPKRFYTSAALQIPPQIINGSSEGRPSSRTTTPSLPLTGSSTAGEGGENVLHSVEMSEARSRISKGSLWKWVLLSVCPQPTGTEASQPSPPANPRPREDPARRSQHRPDTAGPQVTVWASTRAWSPAPRFHL